MSGTKGKSGGARPNTGPKPKKFTIEVGKQYLMSEATPDGKFFPMRLFTVVELDRKLIRLRDKETNNEIVLSR